MWALRLNLNDFQPDQNSKSKPVFLYWGECLIINESQLLFNSNKGIIDSISRLMSYRDKFFNKTVQSPMPSNIYLYSKFRNRLVSKQRKSKITYFRNYFEKNKTNMKMLWTGIRSIVNVKVE